VSIVSVASMAVHFSNTMLWEAGGESRHVLPLSQVAGLLFMQEAPETFVPSIPILSS
jgi:hypothetical protein